MSTKDEDALFQLACALKDDALNSFLDQTCGDDDQLRQRLQQRLDEEQTTVPDTADLPTLPAEEQDTVFDTGTTTHLPSRHTGEVPGSQIGPYTLVEKLGEGGMGTVWKAEQKIPVKRTVALKIIKAGMDTDQVVARFEAERQALAMMDHPNIARVHDAGATGLGRPYFVMELVHGLPITDYCDEKRMPTRERLGLFIDVCKGLQHAHQKGVIHRDIKPGNIIVAEHDGKPVPKLIDFGIAKATDQTLTERTLFTQMGQMMGTPTYMSPEQAAGHSDQIDTRTDVYALGILLYELLTGTTPITNRELREAGYAEMQRKIVESEPPRPSTRLTTTSGTLQTAALKRGLQVPNKLPKLIRGDLDWIVMKALEKEPTRRYETAIGFAADIGRYLNSQPVEATPPSTAYRLKKFVRRNRIATALLLTVLAGTGISVWQAIRASQQSRIARVALAESQYDQGKAWLERARYHQREKNDFAAAMMAAKALGFRGFGAEQQSPEFRMTHPPLIDESKPEYAALNEIALLSSAKSRPLTYFPEFPLHDARFTPDGASIIASGNGFVFILPLDESRDGFIAEGSGGYDTVYGYSNDTLAIATEEGTIEVWDTTSKTKRLTLGFPGCVHVGLSPDGLSIAAVNSDRTVAIWDAADGSQRHSFTDAGCPDIAFSPDGKLLASGFSLWRLDTGEQLFSPRREDLKDSYISPDDELLGTSFSPDGTTVSVLGTNYEMIFWEVKTGKLTTVLSDPEHFNIGYFDAQGWLPFAAYHPDGNAVAIAGEDARIRLFDIHSGNLLNTFVGLRDTSTCVAFSPDGKFIAGGGALSTLKIWEVSSGEVVQTLLDNVSSSPQYSQSRSASPIPYNRHTKTREIPADAMTSVAFGPDGKTLVSVGTRTLHTWELFLDAGSPVFLRIPYLTSADNPSVLSIESIATDSIAISPDGKRLGVAVNNTIYFESGEKTDQRFEAWQWATGEHLLTIPDFYAPFAFSRDASLIAGRARDGGLAVADLSTGDPLPSFATPGGNSLTSVSYATASDLLACGMEDGTIFLFADQQGTSARTLRGHVGSVNCLAFSHDGELLASGGSDKILRIWDIATGKLRNTTQPAEYPIRRVAFERHSESVVAACYRDLGEDQSEATENSAAAQNGATESEPTIVISTWDTRSPLPLRSFTPPDIRADPRSAISANGATTASADIFPYVDIRDASTGQFFGSVSDDIAYGWIQGLALTNEGHRIAVALEETVYLADVPFNRIDLAACVAQGWCRIDGIDIGWSPDQKRQSPPPGMRSPHTHIGVWQSDRSTEQKLDTLFWNYLGAGNLPGALVMLGRLAPGPRKDHALQSLDHARQKRPDPSQ